MRLRFAPLVIATVLLVPGLALATDLFTEGGFRFDLQDGLAPAFGHDGTFSDGFSDAYDGAYGVTVNGTMYSPTGTSTLSLMGRQVEMAEQTIGTLTVKRLVYVPAIGGDFARILDLITNTGSTATTATVAYYMNLGSDGSETIGDTDSGDTVCDTSDNWCESAVTTGSFMMDPTLGTVYQGPGAPVHTTSVTLGSGESRWSFSVPIPAGARVGVLTFAIQKTTGMPTLIRPEATRLVALPDDVMVGMDDYLGDLVNFQGDTPGAPRIRFSGMSAVDEGMGFDVTVAVTDMAGVTPTWTWDLDGDGTFGDTPGATSYSVPAGTTDGPTPLRIGVEATNGTGTSQRYRTIGINNVAPTIDTSTPPPATTSNGSNYTYQIVATDPAGAADPFNYTCTTCPGSMTVSSSGFVQWTPGDLDVTMPLMPAHVAITVDDGDMGSTVLRWDLTVLANHPPTRPSVIYPSGIAVAEVTPRFVAGNATDEDGDALSYFFEIDTVDTFDSPAKISSPGVPQTDGFTAYRPTTPLMQGLQYYWRVRANDTMADSEYAMTSFYTAGMGETDAGVPDSGSSGDASSTTDAGHVVPPPSGGCCETAPGAPSGGAMLMIGVVALVVSRRRRVV